jgi:hypothetical protein
VQHGTKKNTPWSHQIVIIVAIIIIVDLTGG